jgi:predicted metal-dependent hydrolase
VGAVPAPAERNRQAEATTPAERNHQTAPLIPNHRNGVTANVRRLAVEVRRSARRRRTVSAYRDGERVVVLIPAQFSGAEEREWVDRMVARLAARERREHTDEALYERAVRLAERYLPEHPVAAQPASVRWVRNQNGRWGSCTPADRSIRISERIQSFPDWVVDYVIIHELAHLVVANHNAQFWALVGRYPRAERARGYLEGISAATGVDFTDE